MSTEDGTTGASGTDEGAATSGRAPTPGAAAARRARRIGGAAAAGRGPSPSPVARPAGDTADEAIATAKTDTATVDTAKVDTAKVDTAKAETAKAGTKAAKHKRAGSAASADSAQARLGEPTVVTQVPNWLRWLPALLLSAAVVVLGVLLVNSAKGYWYDAPSANQVREEVLSAAKSCTAATNTYNYKTFARDEKAGVACTTGDYTDNYRQAMERLLKPNVTNLKSVQTAQINDAGVEAITPGGKQWSVIVYGQITVSNVNTTQPRVDPFSAVILMEKAQGQWKIVKIDPVSVPTS